MAGRILPVALAAIVGVSIGVATFDGEFKKQRMARMQEEYQRELAAANLPNTTSPSPVAPSAIPPPTPAQLQAKKDEAVASAPAENSWSNTLGLWAWKKDTKDTKDAATTIGPAGEVRGKP